ncbi:hypothetical protein [Thioalkalivibrio nitratireducens]|nr:hypothetical protein [Thioalkalivibrio nitratireducens]
MTTSVEAGIGDEFLERFNGGFTGILHWHQLDALWERLRAQLDGTWHVYAIGEPPPVEPVTAAELDRFIRELDALLRAEHDEEYCGVVYVDSTDVPSLVKIFDPNNLGSSCGSSGLRVLPGWVLSRDIPVDLEAAMPPTRSRRRWWRSLFPG